MRREALPFDIEGTRCDVRAIRHLADGQGSFHAFHTAPVNCPPKARATRDRC